MNFVNDMYQKKARRRTRILVLLLSFWVVAIIFRLLQLQVFHHAGLRAQVIEQNQNTADILPKRGTIYDRNGKILARSVPIPSIFYAPSAEPVEKQVASIRKLEDVLSLTPRDLDKIRAGLQKNSHFVWVKRKVDPRLAEMALSLKINGIRTQEETKRFYPLGTLAAHVLGGVDIDDNGLSGIEYKHNPVLQGQKGKVMILRDAKKREYHFEITAEPVNGRDIILTIDETIQYIAQKELEKAVADNRANWGVVIISCPASGEILAMASVPTFDPNSYPPPTPEADMNQGIRRNIEPGSTFKIVTAAAAIENHRVTSADAFDCREGSITIAGSQIRDHQAFGVLSFPEVIIHSSNVGTIQVGQRIGPELFSRTIQAFRFGRKTGIELPGEEPGKFAPTTAWNKRSLASLSIGYEISVTPLQILQAMNAIANRGALVPPRIIKAIPGVPDKTKKMTDAYPQVMSPAAAEKLVAVLERVVLEGTGRAAFIEGYDVAGKTGTTQKYDPQLKCYSSSKHIALFVGFVPVDKPLLSMIIVLDEPKKDEYYGGQVAAPVFREVARRVLRYLHVYPQKSPAKAVLTASLTRGEKP